MQGKSVRSPLALNDVVVQANAGRHEDNQRNSYSYNFNIEHFQ
jgi:hypothetical protein